MVVQPMHRDAHWFLGAIALDRDATHVWVFDSMEPRGSKGTQQRKLIDSRVKLWARAVLHTGSAGKRALSQW